jgi:macrolide-specific efflux system membrane fusion protein
MRRVRRRRGSILVNAVLAAALVTGAGFGYAAVNDDGSPGGTTRTRTSKVAKGIVMASVSASGTLSSPSDTGVDFTASGKVTEIDVKVGDKVTAGQVLARIDPTEAREALDEAEADVEVAEANLAKAEEGTSTQGGGSSGGGGTTGGTTGKALAGPPSASATATGSSTATARPTGGTAPAPAVTVTVTRAATSAPAASATVDAAEVAKAEQALVQARNKLAEARRVLDGTTLKAPSDGVVASVAGKVGDSVSASGSGSGSGSGGSGGGSGGSSTGSSSTTISGFVVLANPTGMQIKVSFSEADAAKVKAGQAATVTMSVDTSIKLNAKVVSINPLPDGGSSTAAKYSATVAIEGDVSALRTGQAANVQVIVEQADAALYVPSAAVTGTGANASVQVVTNDGTRRRAVTVGVVGDQTTQILTGLAEGDEVVVGTVTTTGGGTGTRRGGSSGGAGAVTGTTGGAGGGQMPGGGAGFPGGGAR